MAENNSANEGTIRAYLAEHGGSVEDAGGRGLTDEMARAIGVDKPATLSAILGQMESEGSITREMRGLRTYRIALANGGSAPPPADAAPVGVEPAGAPASRSRLVSLRESRAAARVATAEAATVEGAETPAAKAVSLRDALSKRTTATALAPPEQRPQTQPAAVPPASPVPPSSLAPSSLSSLPAADRTGGRAVSLRDAIAGATSPVAAPTEDSDWAAPSGPRVASLRDTARAAPAVTPWGEDPEPQAKKARSTRTKPSRSRPLLSVPAVRTPPSPQIMIAVGIVVAGLVLVTVVAVVVARNSAHPVAQVGTPDSSAFACNLVTSADASTAFGDPAGIPHYVLGSCVYADATHELIIDVAQQNARSEFDEAETSAAENVPGIGDGAYYEAGTLRVLEGNSLMLITLTPFSDSAPSPKLLALATLVTPNL